MLNNAFKMLEDKNTADGVNTIHSLFCRKNSLQNSANIDINVKLCNTVTIVKHKAATNVKIDTIYSQDIHTTLPQSLYNYTSSSTVKHKNRHSLSLSREMTPSQKYTLPSLISKYVSFSRTTFEYITTILNNSESNNDFEICQRIPVTDVWPTYAIVRKDLLLLNLLILILMNILQITSCHGLPANHNGKLGLSDDYPFGHSSNINISNNKYNNPRIGAKSVFLRDSSSPENVASADVLNQNNSAASSAQYLDILDNVERSVLIKAAYGTTSTTKRSIAENIYLTSITTIATPPLTTLRYLEKASQQQPTNMHHRNYELDLERDHALPTSAPNADILKSNNNPTYPNPNRYYHGRERNRHILISSTAPSLPSILQKSKNSPIADMPVYSGEMPLYSPPARSFFTPPLPPEYQNPFADKPTLRGTSNDGVSPNTGNYINRRPIPPPSLMPGHERIPLRPPDLGGASTTIGPVASSLGNNGADLGTNPSSVKNMYPINALHTEKSISGMDLERKKTLNTPSRDSGGIKIGGNYETTTQTGRSISDQSSTVAHNARQEVLPSIRRILSGSNGNKGEVPEVLLKQVTSRPKLSYNQPPSSPVVLLDITSQENFSEDIQDGLLESSNINQRKESDMDKNLSFNGSEKQGNSFKTKISTNPTEVLYDSSKKIVYGFSTTLPVSNMSGELAAATSASTTISDKSTKKSFPYNSSIIASSSSRAAAAAAYATWAIAWNIHVYLSVILFTILGVYSLYKILTYNKLTHLFSQSYFICIHLILLLICSSRIFYLCYDAYNIHSTFHIFVSEILLNLPATFLTISFSVLILYLFLKSLNHKNNRYSALIRPLTVIVGCGVHVVLCITLHYVESYTLQNYQHNLYYQQQLYRRQHQQQAAAATVNLNPPVSSVALHIGAGNVRLAPPRVLSLICQIIYIFICFSLGFLYLYIYRILKRILRSKSQNYIHGFQNLSYAIHITIATALLFILLGVLQIFGAISISITRPITTQSSEMDWLQWGYQFSLRLIEIAIITLMSWVAGLKTNGRGLDIVGDGRLNVLGSGSDVGVFGSVNTAVDREKYPHHLHTHHSNMTGFFFPCTSSSSQEQFETDYPAMCNANTNLHTYTMRTGKLIYEDSFALNSLGNARKAVLPTNNAQNGELQVKLTYQKPYDTGSCHSSTNHNNDFSPYSNRLNHHDQQQYGGYVTDITADHYENPNFELRPGTTSTRNTAAKTIGQTSATSTTSCSGGSASGTSGLSQQQMLLLQSDTCYSEPMQQNYMETSNYEFSTFERPMFAESNGDAISVQAVDVEKLDQQAKNSRNKEKKSCMHLEYSTYDNPERRSSNSTTSCSSGGCNRFENFNSCELNFNNEGMLKSGTFNNSGVGCTNACVRTDSHYPTTRTPSVAPKAQKFAGIQTLGSADRRHLQQQPTINASQRNKRNMFRCSEASINGECYEHADESAAEFNVRPVSYERAPSSSLNLKQYQKSKQSMQCSSDGDMALAASDVGDELCASNKPVFEGNTTPGKSISPIVINGNNRFLGIPLHLISPTSNKRQQQLANNISTAITDFDLTVASPSNFESITPCDHRTISNMLHDDEIVHLRTSENTKNVQDINMHNAFICRRTEAPISAEHIIAKNS